MGGGLQGISRTAWAVLANTLGLPIGTSTIGANTSLNVNIEDVDIELVNELAHAHTGRFYELAAGTALGATEIVLVDATGLLVGERLLISEAGGAQKTLPKVTVVSGAPTIVLDGPMDAAYTTAAIIEVVEVNMAVSGSLASPASFVVRPHDSQIWHLTRLNLSMVHKSAATDDKFGSLAPLINGVLIRSNTALLGIHNLTNWRRNQDMIEDMYDLRYSAKAGGTNHGTAGRWSYKQRTGTVVRLDGSEDDSLEILIQDDLTATSNEIADFQIKMQGHVEDIG